VSLTSAGGPGAAPDVEWDAKRDNVSAVIFVNVVEGDHFKEIGGITRDPLPK